MGTVKEHPWFAVAADAAAAEAGLSRAERRAPATAALPLATRGTRA
jgi:hypothetical protein